MSEGGRQIECRDIRLQEYGYAFDSCAVFNGSS